MKPRILVFAGSNRTGAYSGKTAVAAAAELVRQGAEVTHISLADYAMPILDQDLEDADGVPDGAMRLGRLIADHDGMLIATPEYNSSIPPLLKNAIDWVSRISSDGDLPLKPYESKIVALCASSPGKLGGIRALNHLRPILMNVGLEVITPQCSVGGAGDAFDAGGNLNDKRTAGLMEKVCSTLCRHAVLLTERACA